MEYNITHFYNRKAFAKASNMNIDKKGPPVEITETEYFDDKQALYNKINRDQKADKDLLYTEVTPVKAIETISNPILVTER